MSTARCNYVIATCGDPASKKGSPCPFDLMLRDHLQGVLQAGFKPNDQVTVVRASAPNVSPAYYDVVDLVNALPCPVVWLDVPNPVDISYYQWVCAYLAAPRFTHYFFAEDDYRPASLTFRDDMLASFGRARDAHPSGSLYHSTYARMYRPGIMHAAISNGITDRKSLAAIDADGGIKRRLVEPRGLAPNFRELTQVRWSMMFDHNTDFTSEFQALFWRSGHQDLRLFVRGGIVPDRYAWVPAEFGRVPHEAVVREDDVG